MAAQRQVGPRPVEMAVAAPTGLRVHGRGRHVEYQSDYVLRVIEQMGAALRLATRRFAEGASTEESIEATNQAIGLVVDVPAELFVRMSPQTMLSLLEMSGYDDRVLDKIAESLLLQADVFEAEGSFMEAGVRREQAAAVLEFIDPSRAN